MRINVTKDTIYIDNDYVINNGEYNINDLIFNFSAEYDEEGLIKKAVFKDNEHTYEVVIFDNECSVPYEILSSKTQFTLKVYAYEVENEELVIRYSPTPIKIFLREGSYNGSSTEIITPSQFEQYEAQLNAGLVEVGRVNIDAEKENGVTTVSITNRNNVTKEVQVLDGEKGETGATGATGATGNGIASTVLNNDYTLTINYTNGTSYTTDSIRGATGATGANGKDGKDGKDGTNGINGTNGTNGQDGHSPVITATKSGTVTTIYSDGVSIATLNDGTDYTLTSNDKTEIANICLSQLIDGEEMNY